MGKLKSFSQLGQLIRSTPRDSLETFIIYSYLDDGDLSSLNFTILSDWFNALKDNKVNFGSVNPVIRDVLTKHLTKVFIGKLNQNWTDDEWSVFRSWSLNFGYTDFLTYLQPNRRVCFKYKMFPNHK
jgi:hypothetical protein